MGKLERIVPTSKPDGVDSKYIVFSEIQPDSISTGICYVRNGEHRFTKADKPFVKLYLQDVTGSIIPGYIFDIDDFKRAGFELTRVVNNVVQINYRENYLPRYGMTVIIDKLELVVNPSFNVLEMYTGSAKEAKESYSRLIEGLSQKLNMTVSVPYDMCITSIQDYSQGKIGGLAIHYWDMFNILEVYAGRFTEDEKTMLWGTFILYIFTHSNFVKAQAKGSATISLVSELTAYISRYAKMLNVGEGVLELVHIFFGYQPKDIFVRTVVQVSEELVRAGKELNLYHTLPTTREGNAGYGLVYHYPEKVN